MIHCYSSTFLLLPQPIKQSYRTLSAVLFSLFSLLMCIQIFVILHFFIFIKLSDCVNVDVGVENPWTCIYNLSIRTSPCSPVCVFTQQLNKSFVTTPLCKLGFFQWNSYYLHRVVHPVHWMQDIDTENLNRRFTKDVMRFQKHRFLRWARIRFL